VADYPELEKRIEALLADPAHDDNALRQVLEEMYLVFQELLHQIDRITRISDRSQAASRDKAMSITSHYQKQLRRLEKSARISDQYQSMLRDLNEALKEASIKDALTGVGNRRMLMEHLKAEAARAGRMERQLTLALIDVDYFKRVNDTHGHDAGDKALIAIARAIQAGVRSYDLCGRWGGEEFMVIMPEIGSEPAKIVVERIRKAICEIDLRFGDQAVPLSASFGIAEHRSDENISETIRRADEALFVAKGAGRNRYAIAP
jgi:diguanylate cyclase (GGDEF)-like protein